MVRKVVEMQSLKCGWLLEWWEMVPLPDINEESMEKNGSCARRDIYIWQNCIRGLAATRTLPHVAVRVWQMTWDGKGDLPAARTQSN